MLRPSPHSPDAINLGSMSAVVDVSEPSPETPPPSGAGVEKPSPSTAAGDDAVTSVVQRFKRVDRLEKSALFLRALTCLFSLISILVMGTNDHGNWKNFGHYQEYMYLVAIGVIAFLYSMGQVGRQVHRVNSGRDVVPRHYAGFLDFAGDQVIAYLLISAFSAAIPLTNRMREGAVSMFTEASAASISMAFLAFAAMSLSAMVSGYKLSKQTYI